MMLNDFVGTRGQSFDRCWRLGANAWRQAKSKNQNENNFYNIPINVKEIKVSFSPN